ncbi:Serine/threonine-protein kinase [Lachnellula occidentalis]|uniref:EKC/KEOPS complex subunit BUD32 n=1 Tax=Lachnellula occidentalis TaxID=215460 RepID=A0A8H8RNF5_9HELO|nr:Serine/threonine-protein kinase [Lachnellula occidentalis]
MTSIFQAARNLFRKPLKPLRFPTAGYEVVNQNVLLEEEKYDDFKEGIYYPVNIGDVFASKYQVVGKLGFGATSTVWLERDLQLHSYATLKVFTREGVDPEELNVYKSLSAGNASSLGRRHVRTALDVFTIPRQGGDHKCLIQKPMWDSFKDLLNRNPTHRFNKMLLRAGLSQVLLALDYLHSECKLVHTDISAHNILIEIDDTDLLDSFIKAELESPSPRKIVDGAPVYGSRRFDLPKKYGLVVLSDFGSAVRGDGKRTHDAQPNVYRCPEVMLKMEWSYPADIWNVGAMIWDLFEDKHLFYGYDPDGSGYKTRAHLAEVVGLLGPPPPDLLKRGFRSKEFFDEEGNWIAGIPIPKDISLESLEENLTGGDKQELRFVRSMLQWRPEDRKTAKQLLDDPWLNSSD